MNITHVNTTSVNTTRKTYLSLLDLSSKVDIPYAIKQINNTAGQMQNNPNVDNTIKER